MVARDSKLVWAEVQLPNLPYGLGYGVSRSKLGANGACLRAMGHLPLGKT